MRRILKIIGLMACFAITLVGVFAYFAARATQQVPEFYQEAVDSHIALEDGKDQLEAQVEQLAEQVKRVGKWEARFTSDQINAWLAAERPKQFRNILPKGTADPRVHIQPEKILVAAKYKNSKFDTVISFELNVQLTDEPNVIAVRVRRLFAGALPIPIKHFSGKISKAAMKGDLHIRWEEEDGNPIALITVPSDHERYVQKPVIIESLDVGDSEILLSGTTGLNALSYWLPVGPVYEVAKTSTARTDQL